MLRWLTYGTVFLASMLSGVKSTRGQEPKTAMPAEVEAWLGEWPRGDEQREAARTSLRQWLLRQLNQEEGAEARFRMGVTVTRDGDVIEELKVVTERHGTSRGFVLTPDGHVGRGPALVYFANAPYSDNAIHAQPAPRERQAVEEFVQHGYVVMVVYPSAEVEASDAEPDGGRVDWAQTVRSDFWLARYFFARRDVDPERVAVFGVGSAARRAWWIAALEQRVAAVVSFGGLGPGYRDMKFAGPHETAPLLRLIAPRPHWMVLERGSDKSQDRVAFQRAVYRLDDLESLYQPSWVPRKQWAPDSRAWREACQWLKDEL